MSSAPPPPPPSSDPHGSSGAGEDPARTQPQFDAPPHGDQPPYEAPPQGDQASYLAPAPGEQPPAPSAHEASHQGQGGPPQYGSAPGQPQQGGHVGTATPLGESEEKTWAILAHLSAPVAALISAGLLNFVGPLVIWALFKDRSQRVRHASAGAFNFNLTLWIAYAVLVVLSVISLGLLLIVTIPLGVVIWVVSMVLHVLAAIKASNGEVYTYPAQIPVLK